MKENIGLGGDLITRAYRIRNRLSANGHGIEPMARSIITELCDELLERGVVIRRGAWFELSAFTADGRTHPLTLRERALWLLFRVVPARFYDREAPQ
jgi:hypothetical protein